MIDKPYQKNVRRWGALSEKDSYMNAAKVLPDDPHYET